MQLEFRLRPYLLRYPYPRQILRPVVTATVIGPVAGLAVEAIVDTGADHVAFGEHLARYLGVDLSKAPQGRVKTASGQFMTARFAPIRLRLMDGLGNRMEWDSHAAFIPGVPDPPMLGYVSCREYFDVVISETSGTFTLIPNYRFPGYMTSSAGVLDDPTAPP